MNLVAYITTVVILSTTFTWAPSLTNCDGTLATDLSHYVVEMALRPDALVDVGRTVGLETMLTIEHPDLLPGECLYARVNAIDEAGNSSETCLEGQ